jgi:hypothetical protein
MDKRSKKYYIAPLIEVISLDVMLQIQPPSNAEPNEIVPNSKDQPSFGTPSTPSSINNPFGGSRPDYGDL